MSKDMALRSVILRLRPLGSYPAGWYDRLLSLLTEHRWEILGDIVAELSKPAPALEPSSRWSSWERDVLARVPLAEQCQEAMKTRQAEQDADDDEAHLIREYTYECLSDTFGTDPETLSVFIGNKHVGWLVGRALDEKVSKAKAKRIVERLRIPGLKPYRTSTARGVLWTGEKVSGIGQIRNFIPPAWASEKADEKAP
jgi:hypothetical protein